VSQKNREYLNQIEALVAALRREGLERRLVLLSSQQRFLDDASRYYFELWRLKSEAGLEVLQLSPYERQSLEYYLGHDIFAKQLQTIEGELRTLINQGRYLTFAEIEGMLKTVDGMIERLENLMRQIGKQEQSTLQAIKTLTSKVMRVCGGIALVGVDLPVQNWASVITGAILVLTTSLNDK
jgi:hypothetical protein